MATEKRLIWDEDAKRRIIALATGFHTDRLPVDMVINVILHQAPTVDAVEVVHAKWECVYDESMGETDVTCSHCKDTRTIKGCYVTVRGEPCYFEDNYCPNCGAKMDGERRSNG